MMNDGLKNYWKGKKHTEETKEKQRKAKIGKKRPWTKEWREKIKK